MVKVYHCFLQYEISHLSLTHFPRYFRTRPSHPWARKPSKANPSVRRAQLGCGWRGPHPAQSPSRPSPSAWRPRSCFPSRAPAADPPGMLRGPCLGTPVTGYLKWTWTPSLTRVIQTVARTLFTIQHKCFTFQDTHALKPDGVCMKTVVTDSIWHPSAHFTVLFSPSFPLQ